MMTNIAEHMQHAGNTSPDRPAVALGATILLRYGELADRVSRLAYTLRQNYRLQPGDRVALIMKNCPAYLETLYACWHSGFIAVPINAKLHARELAYILQDSGARVCLVTSEVFDSVSPLMGDPLQAIIDVNSEAYERLFRAGSLALTSVADDHIAWLFYTSGTTGKPKGAMLSHGNLLAMCRSYFSDVDPLSPWMSILHAAPMSHGSGLYALAHVMRASCHVIPQSNSFDAAEVYKLIECWPGLVFFAAPTMVKRLIDFPVYSDTTNLKTIIYGGGPMYLEDTQSGLRRFGPKLAQLYGQGESPMTITALSSLCHADGDHPRWLQRLASVGTPQSSVEVRVGDSRDEQLAVGEIGEILVRGETVMQGYWGKPEATAKTLRNGWLHTGDFGCFDADGFLTLKDRGKDLIISGGSNIYPREVEEVLIKHPAVAEVSVIGRNDSEWGEIVVAYLVPKVDESGLDMQIEFAEINQLCLQNIARFKRPKHYRIISVLPKNNYGKVLKTELRLMEEAR
jgi:long-chain acyl-CoA synthetase